MTQAKSSRKCTSFDVAARAGVSQSTVSRALSGDPHMRSDTRRRVQEAARELGYVLNSQASHLRRQTPRAVMIVVLVEALQPCRPDYLAFMDLVQHLIRRAETQGLDALLSVQEPGTSGGPFRTWMGIVGLIVLGEQRHREEWLEHNSFAIRGHRVVEWGPNNPASWVLIATEK